MDSEQFPHHWYFLKSVPSLKFLPPEGPPEVCFAGRSNVGKSSLINILLNNKSLARTSNTPGRTQELNYFCPQMSEEEGDEQLPPFVVVDMPGYGYAKAPKDKVDSWTELVFSYFRGRRTLKRVYLLIDSRHGIKKNDLEVMELLDKAAASYQVVLTKIDKISQASLKKLEVETIKIVTKRPAAYPEIIMTSSEKKTGVEEVRRAILTAIKN